MRTFFAEWGRAITCVWTTPMWYFFMALPCARLLDQDATSEDVIYMVFATAFVGVVFFPLAGMLYARVIHKLKINEEEL